MPENLLKGFRKFRENNYESRTTMPDLIEKGQNPDYFVISCIDSRSNPATVFRAKPGAFFTFKAMGAIVRPYKQGTALSAGLQFALNYNNVSKIILLGHTGCGAIKALINNIDDPEIASFMDVTQKAVKRAKDKANSDADLHRRTEEEIVLLSRENLKTYPAVANALAENRVQIVPWLFDMENGDIFEYDETSDQFINKTNISSNTTQKTGTGCGCSSHSHHS